MEKFPIASVAPLAVLRVRPRRAHGAARAPGLVHGDAGLDRDVLERPVSLVAVEVVGSGVVGDEEIHAPVSVEVIGRDAERFLVRIGDSGFLRHVFEPAVPEIAVEVGGRPRVPLGRAIGLRLPVERAEEVLLRGPVHVAAHEEVEQPVAVEVEPGGRRAPARVGDAGLRGDLLEAPSAEIVEEEVALEGGDVDVVFAVVVEIGHRGAHSVEDPLETGLARDVAKAGEAVGAGALVPVEGEGRRLVLRARIARPEGARNEEEVGPAVAVVVEDGDAAPHRLRHPLLAASAVDVREVNPHRLRLLLEARRGNGSRPRRKRRRGLHRLLFPARGQRENQEKHEQGPTEAEDFCLIPRMQTSPVPG